MTTVSTEPEELAAWHAALKEGPGNSLLRGVFADWLDDRGEAELAAGYRALARYNRRPEKMGSLTYHQWWQYVNIPGVPTAATRSHLLLRPALLPWVWSRALNDMRAAGLVGGHSHDTLQSAEDAAALAWSRMTDRERQYAAKLLTPSPG